MKVYFFLSRKRTNRKGVAPIVCRIAKTQFDRDEFRTGIFISPDNWDSVRGLPLTGRKSNKKAAHIERLFYSLPI